VLGTGAPRLGIPRIAYMLVGKSFVFIPKLKSPIWFSFLLSSGQNIALFFEWRIAVYVLILICFLVYCLIVVVEFSLDFSRS